MPIRVRQPAPTLIQDSLPLPPKLPDLPADVMERFPSLRSWQQDTTAWYRKLAGAIQDSNRSISQTTTQVKKATDVLGVELIERFEELEDEVGNLFGKYTLQVVAGDVVTGMVLTSATGDTPISDVTFQASSFKIFNSVTGISMFDVSGTTVRLAGTLVVSTSGKVFIGTGTWGNSNTSFYVDDAGQFSLKDKLTWNGTTLTVNGTITSTSGTIGGFTLGANSLTAANGNALTELFARTGIGDAGYLKMSYSGNQVLGVTASSLGGAFSAYDGSGTLTASMSGATGTVEAINVTVSSQVNTNTLDAAGAISIGNTVAAAVGVASTHKATVVISGTTYYFLLTNV